MADNIENQDALPQSQFWDRMAAKYFKDKISDPAVYQEKLTITQGYFTSESRVLEFGCGTGGTAIVHAPHVKHIQAIDVSQNMLNFAEQQKQSAGITNIDFERNSIESYDAPLNSFDVVLGLSILHLVEDRSAVIAKVHRLLKPGGVFVSSTTCMGDRMIRLIKYVAPLGKRLGVFPDFSVIREEDLAGEIQSAGFTLEKQWRPENAMATFMVARK